MSWGLMVLLYGTPTINGDCGNVPTDLAQSSSPLTNLRDVAQQYCLGPRRGFSRREVQYKQRLGSGARRTNIEG